jgi:hypothetical protein
MTNARQSPPHAVSTITPKRTCEREHAVLHSTVTRSIDSHVGLTRSMSGGFTKTSCQAPAAMFAVVLVRSKHLTPTGQTQLHAS